MVLVIGGVYLCVMLRVQLNILAGFLYHHQDAASLQPNNNIKYGKISQQMQEKFMSINSHFVQQGRYQISSCEFNLIGHAFCPQVLRAFAPLSVMLLNLLLTTLSYINSCVCQSCKAC